MAIQTIASATHFSMSSSIMAWPVDLLARTFDSCWSSETWDQKYVRLILVVNAG